MIKIAIFASGSGTNAENIIHYFSDSREIKISLILSNNPAAYVLERAKNNKISSYIFNRKEFYETEMVIEQLKEYEIDFIVLAGFMWMVPLNILKEYPNKILNIHPALLPKFGGKGMYGDNVHKAVVEAKEEYSGITIHYVNEKYDEGEIIYQAKCIVEEGDTPECLAKKVHYLEYEHYPNIIKEVLLTGKREQK